MFCSFISIKLRFPNILVYAKSKTKCEYISNSFPHNIDLDALSYLKTSGFKRTDGFICFNHQDSYQRAHRAREKATMFFYWLNYWVRQQHYQQQGPRQHCSGPSVPRKPSTCNIPKSNYIGINIKTRGDQ